MTAILWYQEWFAVVFQADHNNAFALPQVEMKDCKNDLACHLHERSLYLQSLCSNGCIVTNQRWAMPALITGSVWSWFANHARNLSISFSKRSALRASKWTCSLPIGPETICMGPASIVRQPPTVILCMPLRPVGNSAACQSNDLLLAVWKSVAWHPASSPRCLQHHGLRE